MSDLTPPEARAHVDARTRLLAQEAGTDKDLGSSVPPLYKRSTTVLLGGMLVVIIVGLVWVAV
ncbi:hypothetical protein [Peteryoungia ipomoeae]|uniref:Uncharacterized protein n=1 Tax=Peteryoungia ipomoeae TaxID=1210932 RepID=A0A4S8NT94_9HYPH|nr:hypothetical protein [Peteryoungia ipomoeae]THV20680.1 hypothetical protein FAA97_18985 [Peteryoungia ipomoeae]